MLSVCIAALHRQDYGLAFNIVAFTSRGPYIEMALRRPLKMSCV